MPYKKYTRIRFDLEIIADMIDNNSTVLDLGCGPGDLLNKLIHEKKCIGHGVEIYEEYILQCVEKGVPVISSDLDEGLGDYGDKSFDFIILSRTLQVVHRPHLILNEMLRVGRVGIVSFPNFGYWRVRSQLFFRGRMPVTKDLPYQWFDTPNIHLLTIKDFKKLCRDNHIQILTQINLGKASKGGVLAHYFPNLFARQAIFKVQNRGEATPKNVYQKGIA
jgi:methionine biosynthesis protein MetW